MRLCVLFANGKGQGRGGGFPVHKILNMESVGFIVLAAIPGILNISPGLPEMEGEIMKWRPYCTSYYRHSSCLELVKKLRRDPNYLSVKTGATMTQNGEKYSKVYVAPRELNK